ncbi:hypothetical protein LEP1GSC047_0195 [Leptospira inadai serovar Lyme str. 10]|uniref:Uncharacterized protein n=2 Tax=Leptospira inadai serovar Lyme TaxID=293084 RepID=V6HQ30_9LEPT|nr:hypothetical protein LEP1GSC047_0195 [Leptospira inadai serovar Lyme str. 10]PNV72115.1 hypothetical protein BES34_020000 [Leptospira inadai serovar Lyme]
MQKYYSLSPRPLFSLRRGSLSNTGFSRNLQYIIHIFLFRRLPAGIDIDFKLRNMLRSAPQKKAFFLPKFPDFTFFL